MTVLILLFALVTVFPIKWAADFTDGQRTGLAACVGAALLGPVIAAVAFRLSSGGFIGFMLSYLALVTTYVVVLRIPGRSIIGFSVIALALQIAVVMALISLGVTGGKVALGI